MGRRLAARLLPLLIVPILFLGFTAGSASALTGGPWVWSNEATGRCLDSNKVFKVYTLGCNGGNYQAWVNNEDWRGDEIKNNQTGLCLDSNGNGDVFTWICNGGDSQRWKTTLLPDGWQIHNYLNERCLDSNSSGKVYAINCNGGLYQRWL